MENKKKEKVYVPNTYAFHIKTRNISDWYKDLATHPDWVKGKVEISAAIAKKILSGEIDKNKFANALAMGLSVKEFLNGGKGIKDKKSDDAPLPEDGK